MEKVAEQKDDFLKKQEQIIINLKEIQRLEEEIRRAKEEASREPTAEAKTHPVVTESMVEKPKEEPVNPEIINVNATLAALAPSYITKEKETGVDSSLNPILQQSNDTNMILKKKRDFGTQAMARDQGTEPMVCEKSTDPKMKDEGNDAWKRDGQIQTSVKSHKAKSVIDVLEREEKGQRN